MKHGKGVWKDGKGNIYDGEYFESKKQGWGFEQHSNNEQYEGNFF